MGFSGFETQERVRISRGKRAINVRAIKVYCILAITSEI